MKSLLIAWKDFKIRMLDRRGFFMMILMPLVLTAILGSALKGSMSEDNLPQTVIAYYQEGTDELGIMLKEDVLQGEQLKELVQVKEAVSPEEARQLVRDGKADAAILIPADWSKEMAGGKLKEPTLITDPAKTVRGSIAETILRTFSEQAKTMAVSTQTVMGDLAQSVPVSTGKLNMGEAAKDIQRKIQESTDAQVKEGTVGAKLVSSMQYYAAGMGVMFLLFNATVGAKMIASERATETLARLLSTPTSRFSILFGKFLGTLLFSYIQFLLFIGATHYGFGVDWGSDTGQLLAVGAAYSICVSGLSMLLAATIRDEKSADVIGGIGIQVLALLGGSMLPIYAFPDALRMVAGFTPNKWALTSLLNIMSGTTWEALLPALTILSLAGLASVAIGTWRMQVR
ncbi:ABC transporter permease [Ectobacillus ponti]|uniref:ABC transporter permease n=1 Tax=Ectobacillus ponti TaxID=2961894 RepID=A0AA41X9A2_9BACI|nr:ABC transporter permease [Ectobacillus ponti]MCP8971264.1 ABC transporter permease [Ectobacillus ponti]